MLSLLFAYIFEQPCRWTPCLLHMTCLPNWTVLYPILHLESSSRTTHAGFRNEDALIESAPYPGREGTPDSNPDGQAHKN